MLHNIEVATEWYRQAYAGCFVLLSVHLSCGVSLQTHQHTHMGRKPFVYDFYGKPFNSSNYLNICQNAYIYVTLFTWKNMAGILHIILHLQFTSVTTGGSYHTGMNCVVRHLLLKHQQTHSSCTITDWIGMCLHSRKLYSALIYSVRETLVNTCVLFQVISFWFQGPSIYFNHYSILESQCSHFLAGM